MSSVPSHVLPAPWIARLGDAAVYFEGRVFQFFFLGFSSGLPYMLPFFTLTYWLTNVGTNKGEIGLFSLVALPFAFKFVWAPFIDRLPFPVLSRLLGRRRGWLLATQIGVAAAILMMAFSSPEPGHLYVVAIAAILVAFLSASQDILIDGYRVEILEERQQGAGAAAYTIGYRIAMLVSGGGVLIIAGLIAHETVQEGVPFDSTGYVVAYSVMAALMSIGIITTLLAPEPPVPEQTSDLVEAEIAQRFLDRWPGLPVPLRSAAAWFHVTVNAPLVEFGKRFGWFAIVVLGFVFAFKLGDTLAATMTGPFYKELGFADEEIGAIAKPVGLIFTIIGALVGGYIVKARGVFASLWIGGILQMLSNFMFVLLAWTGDSLWMLGLTMAVENLSGALAITAFIAYMSGLCNIAYTVTQFALLTSLMNVARTVLASPVGYLAEAVSWPAFFLFTVVAAVPGLVLLWFVTRRFGGRESPV